MPQSVNYFVNFFNNLLTVLILREGIIFPGSEPTWWLREGKLLVRRPGLASQLVARNSKLGGLAEGRALLKFFFCQHLEVSLSYCDNSIVIVYCQHFEVSFLGAK